MIDQWFFNLNQCTVSISFQTALKKSSNPLSFFFFGINKDGYRYRYRRPGKSRKPRILFLIGLVDMLASFRLVIG